MLDSKTFAMARDAIADGAVDGVSDAAAIAQQAADAARKAGDTLLLLSEASDDAYSILRAVTNAKESLAEQAAQLSVTVKDKSTLEAINAFTMVLLRTKEVVGEEAMTEAVWEKAIEAASYCAWRTGSGPKQTQRSGL